MISLDDRVRQLFELTITNQIALVDLIAEPLVMAGQRLVRCLLNDGKIFVCGVGASAANAMHFSSAMLHHFEMDRPPLPVINLVCDVPLLTAGFNEGHSGQIFSRQIQALGQEHDVLILLSTAGHATCMLQTVDSAHDRGMDVIALTGRDGGLLVNHLGPEDIELCVPGDSYARIRETHLFLLHCLCDAIEQSLFGQLLGTEC